MEIDAVILDMDGLMLDTESLYKVALQKAAFQLGFLLDDGFYFTLAGQNLPTAVATSSDQEYAAFSLRAARLDARRFAHVVTGEQVENGKPAPDIYLEAARRLGVNPARSLAIEDSDAGILSAADAGMIAVMVPDLKPPSTVAREKAFRVLTSLHEVVSLRI